MDVLSDVLRAVRLEGALFLHVRGPWCLQAPPVPALAAALLRKARRLAACHVVLEGRCRIQLQNEGGERLPPLDLHAGDAATMIQADAHVLGSDLQQPVVRIDELVQVRGPELPRLQEGGDGEKTLLVCGWFACEGEGHLPLGSALPRLFRTRLRQRAAGAWLEQSLRAARAEAAAGRPGMEAMISKTAEALVLEALRGYLDDLPPAHLGWLTGLKDPVIGRCLAALHEAPGQDWRVDALAQVANLSRSALAERFTRVVGAPPMQYLARLRMLLAAGKLRQGRRDLARIAVSVGYESEAAFNRAFKREFGTTPGQWRRRQPSPGADGAA